MPHPGESLVGDLFDIGPGGKGTNLAVAAARQGARIALVAKVGDDAFADVAFALYAQEGIDSRHVTRTVDEPTGAGLVYLQPSGENTIAVYRGANWLLTPADIEAAASDMVGARILATQLEIPDTSVEAAVGLGRRLGLKVLLTPAPARPLTRDILASVDVLLPNAGEARLLAGLPVDDQATGLAEVGRRLLELGPAAVIITMGAQGCLVVEPEAAPIALPAYPVEAIDTVGAGDAFGGGLAVALAEGAPLIEAARWASVTAALSTQQVGAIPALPRRPAVAERAGAWREA
jgi:ribokinase